jgi:amidohydrolase
VPIPSFPARPLGRALVPCAAALLAAPPAHAQGRAPADTARDAAIARRVDAVLPKVVAWRRDLHQHPELGNRETRTGALVAAHLRALGLEVRTGVAKTGVVGVLRGGRPGRTVALRADMDALPVTEQVALPFASKVQTDYNGQRVGVMHACGHDMHVAMLMGAAEVLAGMRAELPGTVVFLFQPAEEGPPAGETGGAMDMIKAGVLDRPKVDAAFGLHVGVTPAEAGHLSYRPAGMMAAADFFSVTVRGRQVHGATPWAGVDPVVVGAQIVQGLQTIVSRQSDLTLAPVVVTVGAFNAGVRNNIVPDSAVMLGTIRTFDPGRAARRAGARAAHGRADRPERGRDGGGRHPGAHARHRQRRGARRAHAPHAAARRRRGGGERDAPGHGRRGLRLLRRARAGAVRVRRRAAQGEPRVGVREQPQPQVLRRRGGAARGDARARVARRGLPGRHAVSGGRARAPARVAAARLAPSAAALALLAGCAGRRPPALALARAAAPARRAPGPAAAVPLDPAALAYAGRGADGRPRYVGGAFTAEERALLLRAYGVDDPARLYLPDSAPGAILRYDLRVVPPSAAGASSRCAWATRRGGAPTRAGTGSRRACCAPAAVRSARRRRCDHGAPRRADEDARVASRRCSPTPGAPASACA